MKENYQYRIHCSIRIIDRYRFVHFNLINVLLFYLNYFLLYKSNFLNRKCNIQSNETLLLLFLLQATVTFDVTYTGLDGSDWSLNAEQQMLVDIEQNIANLERSLTRRGSWNSHEPSPEQSPR